MKKFIFLAVLLLIALVGYSQDKIGNGLHIVVSSLTDVPTGADTTFTVFIPANHFWQSLVVWDDVDAFDGTIQHQTSVDGLHYSNYYGEPTKVMTTDSSHYAFEDDRFSGFDLRLKLTKNSITDWSMDWYIILKPRQ